MIKQIISDRLPIPSPAALYNDARLWGKALFHLRPDIIQASDGRVKRALNIIARETPSIQQGEQQNTFMVRSCSRKDKYYTVDLTAKTCTCPDDREARRLQVADVRICKHRLAVGMYFFGPEWVGKLQAQNEKILTDYREAEEAAFLTMCRIINQCERIATWDPVDLPEELNAKRLNAIQEHEAAFDKMAHAQNNFPFF